jgi:hypothetical protein
MPKKECSRKIVLQAGVQAAMAALLAIHNQEVAALLSDDFDRVEELRTTLKAARDHETSMVDLYREHVTSHGC